MSSHCPPATLGSDTARVVQKYFLFKQIFVCTKLFCFIYRYAVHGQVSDTVEEVSEGEVDNVDGGVLERSSVES